MKNNYSLWKPRFKYKIGTEVSQRSIRQASQALYNARLTQNRANDERNYTLLSKAKAEERHIIAKAEALVPPEQVPDIGELINLMCLIRMVKERHRQVPDLRLLEKRVQILKTKIMGA